MIIIFKSVGTRAPEIMYLVFNVLMLLFLLNGYEITNHWNVVIQITSDGDMDDVIFDSDCNLVSLLIHFLVSKEFIVDACRGHRRTKSIQLQLEANYIENCKQDINGLHKGKNNNKWQSSI